MRKLSYQSGSVFSGLLYLLVVSCLALVGLSFVFGRVVPVGDIGVRQINFQMSVGSWHVGPQQGFSATSLMPGYHWSIPFYSQIHLIPRTIQILNLDRDVSRYPDSSGVLEIQTNDGNKVHVDVSILTRFYENAGGDEKSKHGGPQQLFKNVGITAELWRNQLRQVAQNDLQRSLGMLATEDFYNPELREKSVAAAKASMKPRLDQFGIELIDVLIRRYTYVADSINTAIFQKNLQAQEQRLNEANSELAKAHAALEQVSAEWDARITTLKVEGDNKSKVTRSQANLYETQKIADGDLLLAKARAEVDRLRAGALAQTAGSEIYVAREMAPLLGSLKGGLVSDIDPYDLDAWVKRLGVVAK